MSLPSNQTAATRGVERGPIGFGGPVVAGWLRRHRILTMIARRVAVGLLTLFVASILIFGAVNVLPGDAATAVLGKDATPEAVASIRANLGLDEPMPQRYVEWAGGIVRGDLGDSTVALAQGSPSAPVWEMISTPLRNTLFLAVVSAFLLVPLALLLGAYSAVRSGRLTDHAISTTSLTLSSMPEFLTGALLVLVFFTGLGALPPISQIPPGESPLDSPMNLVLPVMTLLSVSLAYNIRQIRATTIDTLRQDYVGMARLNGYRETRVIWRYALRNALAPSVQSIAQTLQYLLGGIIITESLFAYPGIGTMLVQAVTTRDIQVVSVIAFLLAAAYIAINIAADVVVVFLVPKLRTQA